MEQIEQTILQLPIPTSRHEEAPYYDVIPFYSSITTPEDFERIGNTLDELQALYANAAKKTLQDVTLPTQIVTCTSLLALRGYFEATGEAVTHTPSFHRYFDAKLTQFFAGFLAYPYMASNNPACDQRLLELLNLTQMHVTNPLQEPQRFIQLYGGIPDPATDYMALLDTEPALKAELEALYTSQKYKENPLHRTLRQDKLIALYVLLNEFDAHGELKKNSVLAAEGFKPLIQKFQQRFLLENAYVSYLDSFQEGQFDSKKRVAYLGERKIWNTGGRGVYTTKNGKVIQSVVINPDV